MCPRLRFPGKASKNKFCAARVVPALRLHREGDDNFYRVSRLVLVLKLHKKNFFLALHAMCERLCQRLGSTVKATNVFFSFIVCVRLCLRSLGELEIENKLKNSSATSMVLAHRVHTNNIENCFFSRTKCCSCV